MCETKVLKKKGECIIYNDYNETNKNVQKYFKSCYSADCTRLLFCQGFSIFKPNMLSLPILTCLVYIRVGHDKFCI